MKYEIITPVITAFDEHGNIDYKANEKIIDFLIEGGVDGILVLGSTGEFTHMSYEEKSSYLKFYYDYIDNRVDLYAGTGSMNFDETVDLTNLASELGYKGSFVIGPYYYAQDQEKLYLYYNELAEKVKGNIYIYNFPARTGHSVEPNTMKRLIDENDNIVGLKDSVTEPGHTNMSLLEIENKEFDVFSGFDDQFLYNISIGGKGCISALSNLVPEIWRDLVKSSNCKEFEKVIKYQGLINSLMPLYDMDCNFSHLFKLLMIHRGLEIKPISIFPFGQIDDKIIKESKKILDSAIEKYKKVK